MSSRKLWEFTIGGVFHPPKIIEVAYVIKTICIFNGKSRLRHETKQDAIYYQTMFLLNCTNEVPENVSKAFGTYQCEHCEGWHITTKVNNERK